jgi:hypothetical protein
MLNPNLLFLGARGNSGNPLPTGPWRLEAAAKLRMALGLRMLAVKKSRKRKDAFSLASGRSAAARASRMRRPAGRSSRTMIASAWLGSPAGMSDPTASASIDCSNLSHTTASATEARRAEPPLGGPVPGGAAEGDALSISHNRSSNHIYPRRFFLSAWRRMASVASVSL